MSVSAHIAAQRTDHGVPHALSCRALGVAASTFYKWHNRPPTPAKRRRAELDVEVRACFDASDGTYGSPRVRACGCRKLCRGWSGGISVLVDESATAGRSNDLEVPIWLVCSVGGDGWSLIE